jgi:hypothetical protein
MGPGYKGGKMKFNLSASTRLTELFGGEDADITVEFTDGYAGHGLYAYFTDYPEEGGVFLGNPEDDEN